MYDFKRKISFMPKWKIFWISKKLHSDIMDFQLPSIHSCETVGKGVCIARMDIGRNNIAYTIIQC